MSLKFAILTSLTERAGSGIELARRFDKSIGYFWPATHQQIYRELDRLVGDALIRQLPQTGPPRRGQPRSFEVTDEGRRLLQEWIGADDHPEAMRSTMAVRLRAAAATGAIREARDALQHHRQQREENLERYREIEQRDFADVAPDDSRAVLQHRVLTLGIEVEQAWVDWCDQTFEELDRLTTPGRAHLEGPRSGP